MNNTDITRKQIETAKLFAKKLEEAIEIGKSIFDVNDPNISEQQKDLHGIIVELYIDEIDDVLILLEKYFWLPKNTL